MTGWRKTLNRSDNFKDLIQELVYIGFTDRQIGAMIGFSYSGIKHARKRFGIIRPPEHRSGGYRGIVKCP